jgi:Protein of unknown function (DUF1616)
VRRSRDLQAVAVLAVLALLVVSTTHESVVRAAPGSFLALFSPGYALSVALVPARSVDRLERLLLSLGLSLCACIVGALALTETPAHLTAGSWSIYLVATTLAACAIGARRRGAQPPESDGAAGAFRRVIGRRLPGPGVIGLAGVTIALASAAVLIARLPASNVQGYTILWALPADPVHGEFSVGMTSDEQRTTSYVLTAVSGRRLVMRRRITLRPGESWQTRGTVATSTSSDSTVLEVSLSQTSRPNIVYRHVTLTLGAGL